jgi:hypothetical protein
MMAEMNWKTTEQLEEERKNNKSPVEVLQETQVDLIMTLMMNGVI